MEEEGEDGADAEADANDPRTLARREKVSNLWEAINARAAANGSATERPPSSSTLLTTLCHSTSGLGTKRAKKASADEVRFGTGLSEPVGTSFQLADFLAGQGFANFHLSGSTGRTQQSVSDKGLSLSLSALCPTHAPDLDA